jgi:hypothetical protein
VYTDGCALATANSRKPVLKGSCASTARSTSGVVARFSIAAHAWKTFESPPSMYWNSGQPHAWYWYSAL